MQYLDASLLKNVYKKFLNEQNHLGIVHVDKMVFLYFLTMARDQAFT